MRTEERKEPRTDVNQYTSHFFKAGGGGGGIKKCHFWIIRIQVRVLVMQGKGATRSSTDSSFVYGTSAIIFCVIFIFRFSDRRSLKKENENNSVET